MSMKLYVGNLSYDISESELKDLFTPFGEIESINIITDQYTGKGKGFGFIEMSNEGEAQAAVMALDGQDCGGRALKVNEAKPRVSRGGGGYGGGGRNRY